MGLFENEMMGPERVARQQFTDNTLRQDEADYDDFSRRGSFAEDDGYLRRPADNGADGVDEVDDANSEDEYKTAQENLSENGDVASDDANVSQDGGSGPIEDQASQRGAPAQLPGVIMPAAPAMAGSTPHFSREGVRPDFDPAQWRTGRTDRVAGKYWRTFGERQRAVGGGIGGFFSALFGRGMARANRQAERRAFDQAPIDAARAWRRERRETGAEDAPARSALRTRLAGPAIEGLSTFPREPGVAYDEDAAGQAHRGFMAARQDFQADREDTSGLPGGVARAVALRSAMTASRMKTAYAGYNQAVGNQRLFEPIHEDASQAARAREERMARAAETLQSAEAGQDAQAVEDARAAVGAEGSKDAKVQALMAANMRAGQDSHAVRQRPRRTPQRVRFKDGPDDAVGQPVNDDAASYKNKPLPTSVRFFPAPIGARTFRGSGGDLTPEQDAYVANLGDGGHPDEISDGQAMDNAEYAWPIRAQMLRMGTMDRAQAVVGHMNQAARLESQANAAGTDPLDSDEFRDQRLRLDIGEEAERDRTNEVRADQKHAWKRLTPTKRLGTDVRRMARQTLINVGDRDVDPAADPNTDLATEREALPRNFFDIFLHMGHDEAAVAARGGAPGGPLIEEE